MDPIAVQIGPLAIRWYGLLIMVGTLAGAYVTSLEVRRRDLDPDHVWNALLVVVIGGLLGARLYHVISDPAGTGIDFSYYSNNPRKILAIWEGGLGIYGALIGGFSGLYLYARFNNLDFVRWADFAALGLPLGQAIGRWGNFFNQELYGYPTGVPWGIPIDPQFRLPPFRDLPINQRFHPTFLYESLWGLVVFGILLFLSRRHGDRLIRGELALLYGILYPLGRFFAEFQRPDAWTIGARLATAQIIALISIAACSALILYRRRLQPQRVG